jgi:hypothetical protein
VCEKGLSALIWARAFSHEPSLEVRALDATQTAELGSLFCCAKLNRFDFKALRMAPESVHGPHAHISLLARPTAPESVRLHQLKPTSILAVGEFP